MDPTVKNGILASLGVLFAPGQVVELRVLGINDTPGFNASGWFNDMQALADAAVRYESKLPTGIYVTINALHEACLARTQNAIVERRRTSTSESDIVRRSWLFLDLDTVRPTDVSSTDAEIRFADESATLIESFLSASHGFPAAVHANSGNGRHLLYRMDEVNSPDSSKSIKQFVERLSKMFTNERIGVDSRVHDPARITKLYGTLARKGANTPDRPHRRSFMISTGVYNDFPLLSMDVLLEAAKVMKAKTKAVKTDAADSGGSSPDHAVDLDEWLRENGIAVVRSDSWQGGVRHILEKCVFDASHTGTSAAIGRTAGGAVFYSCKHNSCADRKWSDVRKLFKSSKVAVKTSGRPKRAVDEDDCYESARQFVLDEYSVDGSVTIRRWRQEFYVWNGLRYLPVETDAVRIRIIRWRGERSEKANTRSVHDILACVEALVSLPSELEPPFHSSLSSETMCVSAKRLSARRLSLLNGSVDIDAALSGRSLRDCIDPLSPSIFSLNNLPFSFPTTAEEALCTQWTDFVSEVLPEPECAMLVQESFGYCFDQSLRMEAFFVLHGKGNNGKSTIMDVLSALLGEENVCSLSMESFRERYTLIELSGKIANVCGDMSELDRVEEGILRSLVSGDAITVQRKYKNAVRLRNRARFFFCTNALPRFSDTSKGVWRRMRLIPFDRVVPDDQIDIHLASKLIEELPGILLWSLQGLKRLRETQRFSISLRCEKAAYDYRLACFPVLTFLDECTTNQSYSDSPAQTAAETLWHGYCEWGRTNGFTKIKPLHTFISDVLIFRPEVQMSTTSKTPRNQAQLHGIRIVDFPPYRTSVPERTVFQ
jgi:P4 family phage/plasmid primase-like protien